MAGAGDDTKAVSRFEWEDALRSAQGPLQPITRLVLFALATWVRRPGSTECFPSIRTLRIATGLSKPTIIDHIKKAMDQGWVEKRTDQLEGMQRQGNVYRLTVPTGKPIALPVAEASTSKPMALPVGVALTSKPIALPVNNDRPVNLSEPTGKADGVRPVNLTPSLSTYEVEGNKKDLELGNSHVQSPDKNRDENPEEKEHGQCQFNGNGKSVQQGKDGSHVSNRMADLRAALNRKPATDAEEYRRKSRGE